jgi:thiaminase
MNNKSIDEIIRSYNPHKDYHKEYKTKEYNKAVTALLYSIDNIPLDIPERITIAVLKAMVNYNHSVSMELMGHEAD